MVLGALLRFVVLSFDSDYESYTDGKNRTPSSHATSSTKPRTRVGTPSQTNASTPRRRPGSSDAPPPPPPQRMKKKR